MQRLEFEDLMQRQMLVAHSSVLHMYKKRHHPSHHRLKRRYAASEEGGLLQKWHEHANPICWRRLVGHNLKLKKGAMLVAAR